MYGLLCEESSIEYCDWADMCKLVNCYMHLGKEIDDPLMSFETWERGKRGVRG